MKRNVRYLRQNIHWLLIIFAILTFTVVILWLADLQAFKSLFALIVIFSILLFAFICFMLVKAENRKEKAIRDFLLNPNKSSEKELFDTYGTAEKGILSLLVETIYEKQAKIEQANLMLADYENYVEMWAHEIKLPLSLLTLILDNQEDNSIPEELNFKLDFVRNQISSNISQILFYHRVKSEKKDYFFEKLNVRLCIDEILQDYAPLIHEKKFKIVLQNIDYDIYTDRRAFEFILGQILGNSIKYCGDKPYLHISMHVLGRKKTLTIQDNGKGVKECDLPYVFERGFTGDSGDTRRKSTGMGLYLVKQLADDLNIGIEVSSIWECGFTISLLFSDVQ